MEKELSKLTTEGRNPNSMKLSELSTAAMLEVINKEDMKVAPAVSKVLPEIEKAVEIIFEALRDNGRLFYVGAGTSGRLGIIDASECPPTFMTPPEMIQTVMAGGNEAFTNAAEGSEDHEEDGKNDLKKMGVTQKDVVVGITASGRTPYPIGALKSAAEADARTISLSCNKNSTISGYADCAIEVIVGPEVLTGSTRMKAATAHKMILNMISTAVMVKLGKVYENLMVDVHASNHKLKERAKYIVTEITNADAAEAEKTLELADWQVKPAIIMIETQVSYEEALKAIKKNNGYVGEAIAFAQK
ncbi:N-acetylmuramic acid 6-phosphate etherase [Alkalicoccus daliensis]|uniref:N-acetylmuramic acid 6-phosphate etherase n=1 Tax=Alkalicoccus daliensis TaxID=745820 RepID=A0A1H0E1L1_9BACI|nr:N-acetylmuramic acid 6-phosphate etherase [Alkalicoccus daliensis]SDN76176.1 N-acetylmuramic acid 6-phosphate etherase [Alkalicoccus daliensis]